MIGGGDVATFNYQVISTDKPFNIHGLEFLPLPGIVQKLGWIKGILNKDP